MGLLIFLIGIPFVIGPVFGNVDLALCIERDQCANNVDRDVPACYCDVDCLQFRDCCKEYISNQENGPQNHSLSNQTCVLITTESYLTSERVGVFMIDTCANTREPCTRKTDLKSMMPVSNKDKTYLNDDCALCNGVSNFRYWKALFKHTDQDELLRLSKGLLNKEIMTEFLRSHTLSKTNVLDFSPSVDVLPRFCPFDVLEQNPQTSPVFYQNPVMCRLTLFKNVEICKQEGCCRSQDFVWCVEYEITTEKQSSRDDVIGVEVIIDFFDSNSKKPSRLQAEAEESSMLINNMQLSTITEVSMDDNGTIAGLEDCINALLLYFQSTHYVLNTVYEDYKIGKLRKNLFVAIHEFRSLKSLNIDQVKQLLDMNLTFVCEGKDMGRIQGNIRVENTSYANKFFTFQSKEVVDTEKMIRIKSHLFSLENPEDVDTCDELILMLEIRESRKTVAVKCFDTLNSKLIENCCVTFDGRKSAFMILVHIFIVLTIRCG